MTTLIATSPATIRPLPTRRTSLRPSLRRPASGSFGERLLARLPEATELVETMGALSVAALMILVLNAML
ncbi:hypothetical protein [Oleisolibacter albus]|uniref:hypothetical protein n=1 Tax=Oleisolibacter albus TaxID=2171757 RepID=UPI000DF3DC72|nr:hypothetical protein [Oleisolibacter albus]